jgi:6-phosphogluconolactonase
MSCALTGGSTALIFLGGLRDADVSWPQITIFFGDERAVPPDHPDSNYGLVERLLLSPLAARAPHCERMRGEAEDLPGAARDYEAILPPVLDLTVLGVGEDGHICSLFPGHPALEVDSVRVLAIEDSPKPPARRLTLSLSYVCASRRVWVVAVGPRKLPLVEAAVAGQSRSTPFDQLMRRAKDVTIFTDQSIRRRFAR